MKLQGIRSSGDGMIIEVHVDLYRTHPSFNRWLEAQGFEDHPFSVFHPAGYTQHMTGRTRCVRGQLRGALGEINVLLDEILQHGRAFNCPCYVEIELVREVTRFQPQTAAIISHGLDQFKFTPSGVFGTAAADIHVKFRHGEVSEEVRRYLLERQFYWVATCTDPSLPKEIATLQTATYESAIHVYWELAENPLPRCVAIHLEQKLRMVATHQGLPMPEVIRVAGDFDTIPF